MSTEPDRFIKLVRALAARAVEIDLPMQGENARAPNGDDYNELWDAIMDEVSALAGTLWKDEMDRAEAMYAIERMGRGSLPQAGTGSAWPLSYGKRP